MCNVTYAANERFMRVCVCVFVCVCVRRVDSEVFRAFADAREAPGAPGSNPGTLDCATNRLRLLGWGDRSRSRWFFGECVASRYNLSTWRGAVV